MILDRKKAATLLDRLESHCKGKGIELPKNKSMRYIELAKAVIKRFHSVVLVEDNGTKYSCNNPKYLKRWALEQKITKAGSPYRMVNCGMVAKGYTKYDKNPLNE